MNLTKKIVASAMTASLLISVAAPALAQSAEDLLSQIQALQEQLNQLLAQYEDMTGDEAPTIEGCTISSFDRNLKVGMSGADVKCLQIILNSDSDTQLAASGVGSSGNETEYFGPLTKAAVIKFQEKYAEDTLAPWGLTQGTGFVGSTTRAKLNELLTAGEEEEEEEEEEVAPGTLGVSLAPDTPAAASVPTNVNGILFTKVKFMAGADGDDVVVNSITLTRGGLGADTDIGSVTLYDGSTKIGVTRSSFDSNHEMRFNIPAGWTIPAGETKYLSIEADLVTAGTYNSLGVVAVGSDASDVDANFPVMGNQMTGVTVSIGAVTVTGEGILTQTKRIGTDDVTLASFSLEETSGKEALSFKGITLKNEGTARDQDIGNVYLKRGDEVLAGPADMVRDYVTLELDSPYTIGKSDKVIFNVIGDIEDGANNNVEFVLKNDIDLDCVGQFYGYQVSVTRDDYNEIGDTGTTQTTISGARLNVNLESTAKETPDEVNNFVFGTFEFTATAEDTRISTLVFNIEESDGDSDVTNNMDIDELELVDPNDGTRYTLTKSGGGDNNANDETWTSNDEIYLTKDVKRTLQVVGDLPSGIGNGDTYNIQMTVSTANLDAEGVISGDTVSDFSVSSLTGKLVSVVSPKLTIIPQPMNPGDAVIDAEDVVLFEGILDANNASAITVDRLKFEATTTGSFEADNIDRVVLYTPLGEEQVITSVTDGEADFNAISINVPAGGQMTFGVKVDVAHTVSSTKPYLHLQLDTVSARDEDGDAASVVKEDGATPIQNGSELTTNRIVQLHGVGRLKFAMPTEASEVKYDRYALGGTAVEWIGRLNVRAVNEPVNIEDLTFFNASAGDTDSVATIELYESDKTTKIAQTLLTNYGAYNIAAFTDLNYEVPEGGSTPLWVKANLRKIGTGSGDTADSGDALQFNVVVSGGATVARGVMSGAALTASATDTDGVMICDQNNNGTYDATSTGLTKDTTVVGSKITSVDLVESASAYGESIAGTLSGGDNKIAILKVETANTQNTDNTGDLLDVVMDRLRFKVTKEASTTINSVTVKRLGGSGNAEALNASGSDHYATSGSAFTDATDVKISSGETAYFLVTANLSLGGNRDWVQVDLDALDTAATANIHWADGDTTHGGGGVGPATYKTLRLGFTSVDGTKILEPYGS